MIEVTTDNLVALSEVFGEAVIPEDGTPYIDVSLDIAPRGWRLYPGWFITKLGNEINFHSATLYNKPPARKKEWGIVMRTGEEQETPVFVDGPASEYELEEDERVLNPVEEMAFAQLNDDGFGTDPSITARGLFDGRWGAQDIALHLDVDFTPQAVPETLAMDPASQTPLNHEDLLRNFYTMTVDDNFPDIISKPNPGITGIEADVRGYEELQDE